MILLDASVSRRKWPENIIDNDLALFDSAIEKLIAATSLLTFQDTCINTEGVLFKALNVMYEESYHEDYLLDINSSSSISRFISYLKFLRRNYLLRKKINLTGDYIWIVDNNSAGYFHWLSDAIPRLVAAMQVVEKPKLVLPSLFKDFRFVEESLKAFSISDVKYIPFDDIYQIDRLYFPTYVAQPGHYNYALMKQIRQKYRNYYANNKNIFLGKKIYVSRAKSCRKILNEREVIDLLTEYGFKSVVFEDYSFHDQVRIVLNAKYLVSNHGAGMTNMLFMDEGTSVLELRLIGDRFNNCYFTLASALDLKYYYQTCLSESGIDGDLFSQISFDRGSGYTVEQFKAWRSFSNSNTIVDLDRLKLNLDLMLGST